MDAIAEAPAPAGPGDDVKALLMKLVELIGAGAPESAAAPTRNQEIGQLANEGGDVPAQGAPTVAQPADPMAKLKAMMAQIGGGAK